MRQPDYEPVFSAKAWEVLLACSKRRQVRIARLAYALADYPYRVGDYQTADIRAMIVAVWPPGWTEEGWLKRRTDKFFGVSEDNANKIVAGLKSK